MSVRRYAGITGAPMIFGDDETCAKWEAECEAQLAVQSSRFAVAPRCRVVTPVGRVFEAGASLTQADLHGGKDAAWRILERHLNVGLILEKDGFDDGPEAA